MKLRSKLALFLFTIFLILIINKVTQNSLGRFFSFRKSFIFGGTLPNTLTQDHKIEKIVQDDLGDKPGTYGVYVQNLNNLSDQYILNGVEPFPSASLYKLILLAAVYQDEAKGELKPDSQLTDTKTHLVQIYGSVDFGYDDSPEEIDYSVSDATDRVARLSDNFAAIMLTNALSSKEELTEMAKSLGMVNTDFGANPILTTPEDIGLFFKKLYLGQVVSKSVSDQLISELEKDEINDRIPAGLPQTATGSAILVAHKTGELPGVRHDGGIIFLPGSPYILVMMSKEVTFEDDAVSNEANLSKDIYGYFSQQTGS